MTQHLHLVSSADCSDPLLETARFDGPPPRTRPSDRLEPWPCSSEALQALGQAAHAKRIPFATAAVVVVERTLLDIEFRTRGMAEMLSLLDERARAEQVILALAEPQRAYLRAISSPHPTAATTPTLIALPMRLRDRVAVATLEACLRPELLDFALTWERAAIATGRSMSEWAAFAALELSAPAV